MVGTSINLFWYLNDNVIDVPVLFSWVIPEMLLEQLNSHNCTCAYIIENIISRCVEWILDNELGTLDNKNKFRANYRKQFIENNKEMLNSLENMIKDYGKFN